MEDISMARLPVELLERIFSYISRPDLCQCNRTCWSWSEIATPAIWRHIDVRLDPRDNPLVDLVRGHQAVLRNFTFTNQFQVDLVIEDINYFHGDSFRQLLKYCLQNFETIQQICTNLPPSLKLLQIKFNRFTGYRTLIHGFRKLLISLSCRDIEETHIDCDSEPWDCRPEPISDQIFLFTPSLTKLRIDLGWLRVIPPPLPRVINYEVETQNGAWSRNHTWWENIQHSRLTACHLLGVHLPAATDLPRTITTLVLLDVTEKWDAFNVAFFTLPNLEVLMFRFADEDKQAHPPPREQSIVCTNLRRFILKSCDFPAWFIKRIGQFCIHLESFVHEPEDGYGSTAIDSDILHHFEPGNEDMSFLSVELIEEQDMYFEAFFIGRGGSHRIYCPNYYSRLGPFRWDERISLQRVTKQPVNDGVVVETFVKSNDCDTLEISALAPLARRRTQETGLKPRDLDSWSIVGSTEEGKSIRSSYKEQTSWVLSGVDPYAENAADWRHLIIG